MGIPTKYVKRLVSNPEVDYPDKKYGRGRRICGFGTDPSGSGRRFACVYTNTQSNKLILTVLWEGEYERPPLTRKDFNR